MPQGLKNSAGMVWRALILLTGIFVAVRLIGYLGGVAIALFFAMVVAALGGPLQRKLAKHMPSALATILTPALHALARVGSPDSSSRRSSRIGKHGGNTAQQGVVQIEEWLRTGPLHPEQIPQSIR